MKQILLVLTVSFLLLTACDKPLELGNQRISGVVASVNGDNIEFNDLEKMLDIKLSAQSANHIDTYEQLVQAYTVALNDLIVQKLIHQELLNKNIIINYARLNNIEQSIIADYNDADFKEILKEDGIDYDFWKKQILASYEKYTFFESVLRPNNALPIEDIEQEYLNTIQNFQKEDIYNLIVYRSSDKNELQKIQKNIPSHLVTIIPMRAKLNDLPDEWKAEVKKLSDNKSSKIIEEEGEFVFVKLQSKDSVDLPDMLELYTNIEQNLTRSSLEVEFEKWLESAVSNSEIKVSKNLLENQINGNMQKKQSE